MAWTVDRARLHDFTITDPENGEEATVYIRKLAQGDLDDRQDMLARMRVEARKNGRDPEQTLQYALGAITRLDMRRSIVKWDIPLPLTEKTFRELDPDVADQIYEEIQRLNPRLNESRRRGTPAHEENGHEEGLAGEDEDPNS